jgi:hypothetical protein
MADDDEKHPAGPSESPAVKAVSDKPTAAAIGTIGSVAATAGLIAVTADLKAAGVRAAPSSGGLVAGAAITASVKPSLAIQIANEVKTIEGDIKTLGGIRNFFKAMVGLEVSAPESAQPDAQLQNPLPSGAPAKSAQPTTGKNTQR